jgi:hypothetical protein
LRDDVLSMDGTTNGNEECIKHLDRSS